MNIEGKQKKITIKFFLNKKLAPAQLIKKDEKGKQYSVDLHPLYILVTYNRRNTHLRSKYGMEYEGMEDLSRSDKGLMKFEEKVITKVIRHEASADPEAYQLIGLKQRYEYFSTSVLYALEKYLKSQLRLAVQKTKDEMQLAINYSDASFMVLYKVVCTLFNDIDKHIPKELKEEIEAFEKYSQILPVRYFTFNFPTLIDWMDGSYITEAEKDLREFYSESEVRKVIHTLDKMIKEKYKE